MMATPARIGLGIAGLGKIAQDQHVPAILGSGDFVLLGVASPGATTDHAQTFDDIDAMLSGLGGLCAVAVCTPPGVRRAVAEAALKAGKHVLLEKPPAMTVSEAIYLQRLAADAGVTLFAAWHSRFAPAVLPAQSWLQGRNIRDIRIRWREDVRVWHPGQAWIWRPGGYGVFDPGINALSILTQLLPSPIFVREAILETPSNAATPLRATIGFDTSFGAHAEAIFDFLYEGPPEWTIEIDTDRGQLSLQDGGARLFLDGQPQALGPWAEYPALYAHFASLIRSNSSDVDLVPMQLAIDALAIGRHTTIAPFHE